MSQFQSDFLRILDERGFIHQISDASALDARLLEGPITAYIGFDCTAPSLHAGSLVPIMILHWLQQTGHKPVILMGGGTTKVGDPSGKDESRIMLTDDLITQYMAGIRKNFTPFVSFGDGPGDALMVNNANWLDQLNYIEFLRDFGPHFTINRMMTFDSVKLRLDREQPLTLLEFNYMVLQAYDFLELSRRHGCTLQMGGSDQWGNIVNGMELGRRVDAKRLFALTSPLLTTSSGAKMGKSAAGAIWLDAEMLKPYDYWQFWRSCDDDDVGRFLKLFTTLPLPEIARLEELKDNEINEAKKVLATEATAMLHGRDAAARAAETARKTFEQGERAEGLPRIDVARSDIGGGMGLLTALVTAGLAASNGEARRHVQGGAIRINDVQVRDPRASLSIDDINDDDTIKVSMGKKRHVLLSIQ